MFGVEYQDCSKANILCDKYRYFCMDALNIAENIDHAQHTITTLYKSKKYATFFYRLKQHAAFPRFTTS